MRRTKRRVLSILLMLALVFNAVPVSAYADLAEGAGKEIENVIGEPSEEKEETEAEETEAEETEAEETEAEETEAEETEAEETEAEETEAEETEAEETEAEETEAEETKAEETEAEETEAGETEAEETEAEETEAEETEAEETEAEETEAEETEAETEAEETEAEGTEAEVTEPAETEAETEAETVQETASETTPAETIPETIPETVPETTPAETVPETLPGETTAAAAGAGAPAVLETTPAVLPIEYPEFSASKTIDGIEVSVHAEEGVFPKGSKLSVRKLTSAAKKQAEEAVSEVREEGKNVAVSYTFDIKILDKEGEEVQPEDAGLVKVSFKLKEAGNENLEGQIYHHNEDGEAEALPTENGNGEVSAETPGFSFYTVEFTYNELQYVLEGGESIALSDILASLGLSGEVSAVKVSDESLFSAAKEDGAWVIYSHRAFSSEEWMKVSIGGIVYVITVTDAQEPDIAGGTVGTVKWRIDAEGNLTFSAGTLSRPSTTQWPWWGISSPVTKIIFEGPITCCSRMDRFLENIGHVTEIEGIEYLNTSNVTDMSHMFSALGWQGSGISSLDLSTFDTSKVTNMAMMFSGSKIGEVDLSKFNTSQVTNMINMFSDSAFQSLDLSSFDTSKVTSMAHMFYRAYIREVDLSSFRTPSLTSMYRMFDGCYLLKSADLSSFDTSNVTTMNQLFCGCNALKSVDISSFKTSKVTDMSAMFTRCYGLTSLDLSHFDTSSATTMYAMFYECSGLESLDVSSFDTSKVKNMNGMFGSMRKLQELDISNFDTSSVTDMTVMFSGSTGIRKLVVGENFKNRAIGKTISGKNAEKANLPAKMYRENKVPVSTGSYNGYVPDGAGTYLQGAEITFFPNGGSGSYYKQLILYGMPEPLIPNRSSNAPLTFNGWNMASNGTGTAFRDEQTVDYNDFGGNKYLYAQWKKVLAPPVIGSLTNLALSEAKLPDGTSPDGAALTQSGSFSFEAPEGLKSITVNGVPVSLSGEKNVINYPYGELSLVLDISTNTVSYAFRLDRAATHVNTEDLTEQLTVVLTDLEDQQCTGEFQIYIQDDAPMAEDRTVNADRSYISGSVSFNYGADGPAAAGGFKWLDEAESDHAYVYLYDNGRYNYSLKDGALSNILIGQTVNETYRYEVTDGDGSTRQASLQFSLQGTGSGYIKNYYFPDYNGKKLAGRWDADTGTLTFVEVPDATGLMQKNMHDIVMAVPSYGTALKRVVIATDITPRTEDCKFLFSNCGALADIEGLSRLNMSHVTSLESMFFSCKSLESLDLSSWDVSSVGRMFQPFGNCEGLKEVNISGWNTKNCESFQSMFSGCYALKNVYADGFTLKKGNIQGMFFNCRSLESIDAEKWNFSGVTGMYSAFYGCESLKKLDLSSWDLSKVTTMQAAFSYCTALEEVKLGERSSGECYLGTMFFKCSSLKKADFRKWTIKATSMQSMFYNCSSLEEVDFEGIRTDTGTYRGELFYGCNALRRLTMGPGWVNEGGGTGKFPVRMFETAHGSSLLPAFERDAKIPSASEAPVANGTNVYEKGALVLFEKNDEAAEGFMADQLFLWNNAEQNLNRNAYSLGGHTMTGWNTDAEGKGTSYSDAARINYDAFPVNGSEMLDLTLYAQWEKIPEETTAPEETTTAPEETTTAPEETTTAPEETSPQETTAPEETTPEETTPEESTPSDTTAPEETTPADTTAPGETAPQETTPAETTPAETTGGGGGGGGGNPGGGGGGGRKGYVPETEPEREQVEIPAETIPAPAPVIVPAAVPAAPASAATVAAAPAAPETTAPAPTAAAVPETVLETPAETEAEIVVDEEVPQVALRMQETEQSVSWSLLNLLLSLIAAVMGIAVTVQYVKEKRKPVRLLGLLIGAAAILLFLMTQDLNGTPVFLADRWTSLTGVLAAANFVIASLTKKKEEDEEENAESAEA